MEQIIMIDNMPDGDYKQNIMNILQSLDNNMPNYFNTNEAKALTHEDSVEVEIPLSSQKMSEFLIDELVNKMKLNVFFVIRRKEGKEYNSVLYSEPIENNMYIVYVQSHMFGLIRSVVFQFYDSMDIMYDQLYQDYRKSKKLDGDRIEQEPIRELINKFY